MLFFIVLCYLCGVCYGGSEGTTITTYEAMSAQPTTLKSIDPKWKQNFRRNYDDDYMDPIKPDVYLWSWDVWCQFQPRPGNCSDAIQKFYYDKMLDQCLQFTYSGCWGNKNRFDDQLECDRYCKGSSMMSVVELQAPTYCVLQPDPGMCLAYIPQFYYDASEQSCKEFGWSGCGGNENRFATSADCESVCFGQRYRDIYGRKELMYENISSD